MPATSRFGLAMLAAGQANKEIAHNEAIQLLDALVAACVEEGPRNDPPAPASPGVAYVVGPAPTGAWSGKPGQLAAMTDGGWRFVAPKEGMAALIRASGDYIVHHGGTWEQGVVRAQRVEVGGQQVVSTRSAAIAAPSGGSVIDASARATLESVLSALRHHGLIAT